LGFVFAGDEGGATIGVVVLIAEGLGFMITKAIESAVWLNLTTKCKAKETICPH
jgi:hypothetical protein